MLKRTLVFSNPVILSLHRCQLVITYKDLPDEAPVTVPIEDIGMVMVENCCCAVNNHNVLCGKLFL